MTAKKSGGSTRSNMYLHGRSPLNKVNGMPKYDDRAIRGIVLNIERFAIHDGPGIRSVVFMKGCPLRCLWCSTVDGQRISPEIEYFVEKCIKCKACVEVCPTKAIKISDTDEMVTDQRYCDSCGKCAAVCPTGARRIIGEEMTVGQVLEEIEKDTLFYSNSGGGITLSGGEPTMQPEFSLGILKRCKERGIHTAIETCGYVKWDILDEILKYLDLVYMDIKHMSPVSHEKLTTKGNRLILRNIRTVTMKYPGKSLVIRIPVIPGYNDSDENIGSTAQFVRQLEGDYKIELLPYHKLGVPKYRALSKDYSLPSLESPSEEHLHALQELAKSHGLQTQIGG
jgi:pyruvate formate lyase activating enzyme